MNTFKQWLAGLTGNDSRFSRYYGGVAGDGSGYPSADEARRDLRDFDRSRNFSTWQR